MAESSFVSLEIKEGFRIIFVDKFLLISSTKEETEKGISQRKERNPRKPTGKRAKLHDTERKRDHLQAVI